MVLRTLIGISVLFASMISHAGIFDIAKRPLRVLNVDSEIYVFVEGDLRNGTTYQDGKSVLPGYPPFDEKKPYCSVKEYSIIPSHENRKQPLKLQAIEGAVVDETTPHSWNKFITKIHLTGNMADIDIDCFSESKGLYKEIKLGEFETTFGKHLRYGNLSLADHGVEMRNPLYGEYDVLTPDVLRKYIQLTALQPIKLTKNEDGTALEVTIAEGKILETNNFDKPYCNLLYIAEEGEQLPSEVTLPKDLKLKFTSSVIGSYQKGKHMNHGFVTMADLTGFTKPIRLYCSSLDPNKPLRYLGARYMTKPILDWSYTFNIGGQ